MGSPGVRNYNKDHRQSIKDSKLWFWEPLFDAIWPGCEAKLTTDGANYRGTDWKITLPDGSFFKVDSKNTHAKPSAIGNIAIETLRDVEREYEGWALAPRETEFFVFVNGGSRLAHKVPVARIKQLARELRHGEITGQLKKDVDYRDQWNEDKGYWSRHHPIAQSRIKRLSGAVVVSLDDLASPNRRCPNVLKERGLACARCTGVQTNMFKPSAHLRDPNHHETCRAPKCSGYIDAVRYRAGKEMEQYEN